MAQPTVAALWRLSYLFDSSSDHVRRGTKLGEWDFTTFSLSYAALKFFDYFLVSMFVPQNWMKAARYSGQHAMSWPAGSEALPWRLIVMAPFKFFLFFKRAREGGI